jgi:hypothetical protein
MDQASQITLCFRIGILLIPSGFCTRSRSSAAATARLISGIRTLGVWLPWFRGSTGVLIRTTLTQPRSWQHVIPQCLLLSESENDMYFGYGAGGLIVLILAILFLTGRL